MTRKKTSATLLSLSMGLFLWACPAPERDSIDGVYYVLVMHGITRQYVSLLFSVITDPADSGPETRFEGGGWCGMLGDPGTGEVIRERGHTIFGSADPAARTIEVGPAGGETAVLPVVIQGHEKLVHPDMHASNWLGPQVPLQTGRRGATAFLNTVLFDEAVDLIRWDGAGATSGRIPSFLDFLERYADICGEPYGGPDPAIRISPRAGMTYWNLDSDRDRVPDGADNCATIANADQADADGDGWGDACDDCPADADVQQIDDDGDGLGNACDPGPRDPERDGVPDGSDNCPLVANPSQNDRDGDGAGDACDDSDADGWIDQTDNCPDTWNPDQADSDGNAVGDACEV